MKIELGILHLYMCICREDQTKIDMKKREILQAALSFVPQHGWTRQSLALGTVAAVCCCAIIVILGQGFLKLFICYLISVTRPSLYICVWVTLQTIVGQLVWNLCHICLLVGVVLLKAHVLRLISLTVERI